jgi:hypothetical protein
MSSLQQADEEIYAAMEPLKGALAAWKGATDPMEKKKLEREVKRQMKQVTTLVSGLRALVGRTRDPTEKEVFDKKRVEYTADLHVLHDELKAVASADREAKAGAAAGSWTLTGWKAHEKKMTGEERKMTELMGEGGVDGSGFTTSAQVLGAGQRVNNDALESLKRSERLQNSAGETGLATLQTLAKQTELIYQVDEELANLKGNIDRASRDVQWFARHMAGDKCFLCMFCMLIVALMVLVFWKIISGRSEDDEVAATSAPGETTGPATTTAPPPTVTLAATMAKLALRRARGM